ncbi:MAG: ferrochelatase [Planctomycetota bacterium]|nr:MAG: ferrochelatase [Planctomycetota bacterium]
MSERPALLLLGLGTPEAPRAREVRRYLAEFLDDPRVIDLPAWRRRLLLNTIILPFRPRRSAAAYRAIWTEEGSPLLLHGLALRDRLREALGERVAVELAMRYGKPAIAEVLDRLQAEGSDRVVAFPLFAHTASSSWGSALEHLYACAGRLPCPPQLEVVAPYYAHPAYIGALAAVAGPVLERAQPDKLLMSFHGVPERHVRFTDRSGAHCLRREDCCVAPGPALRHCYRAQCFATARALAAALGLEPGGYEVAFQSRLGRARWIGPATDARLRALPGEGVRRLAVVEPSFTADCLETLEEIGLRGREDFLAGGGEELTLVPCLNSDPAWVRAVLAIAAETGALRGLLP